MEIDYYAYNSGMRKWNSGIKMLFSMVTLILVIVLNNIYVSLFIVATMAVITVAVGKTGWRVYLRFMTVPLAFMIISGFTIAAEFSFKPVGEVSFHIIFFYICFTMKSVMTAVNVFFKAMAGMSCLYMLAFSTPVNEIVIVMERLHLPGILCELMNLIYRYIFILLDTVHTMQTAAKARLGSEGFIRSCRSFSQIAGNLFIISLKRANAYYDAMLSRGYEGEIKFLNEEYPVKLWQVTASVVYFMILILIAFIR